MHVHILCNIIMKMKHLREGYNFNNRESIKYELVSSVFRIKDSPRKKQIKTINYYQDLPMKLVYNLILFG